MILFSSVLPLIFSAAGMITGLFIFFNPPSVIEIQRRFYEKINWRIQPISMEKELRNTRIMGFILAGVSFVSAIFILKHCKIP